MQAVILASDERDDGCSVRHDDGCDAVCSRWVLCEIAYIAVRYNEYNWIESLPLEPPASCVLECGCDGKLRCDVQYRDSCVLNAVALTAASRRVAP